MYTGPMKKRPKWPFPPSTEDMNSCDRDAFLTEQDTERKFREEHRRCDMRRTRPGFAKLDDLRYGG